MTSIITFPKHPGDPLLLTEKQAISDDFRCYVATDTQVGVKSAAHLIITHLVIFY